MEKMLPILTWQPPLVTQKTGTSLRMRPRGFLDPCADGVSDESQIAWHGHGGPCGDDVTGGGTLLPPLFDGDLLLQKVGSCD